MSVEASHPLFPIGVTGVTSLVLVTFVHDNLWIVAPFAGKLAGDWDKGLNWTWLDVPYWIVLFMVAYLMRHIKKLAN